MMKCALQKDPFPSKVRECVSVSEVPIFTPLFVDFFTVLFYFSLSSFLSFFSLTLFIFLTLSSAAHLGHLCSQGTLPRVEEVSSHESLLSLL